jgi:hypothetical protein
VLDKEKALFKEEERITALKKFAYKKTAERKLSAVLRSTS